jgi:hypothetical protein
MVQPMQYKAFLHFALHRVTFPLPTQADREAVEIQAGEGRQVERISGAL